jgi:hypothetical protein
VEVNNNLPEYRWEKKKKKKRNAGKVWKKEM